MIDEDMVELENTFLTFYAYEKLFGINIGNVVQIISYQPVSKIPEFPPYAVGVINLRGDVIPIIDFSVRFGQEPKEYNERTCIIVTKIRDGHIGFVVDAVDEVIKIDKEDISEPPKVIGAIHDAYLMGIGRKNNKKSLLLDIEKVVLEDEISAISREVSQWKQQN
ncbi:MAG: purine-binding chemotaxis protein CheW [Lachnospiraceae bacterium]|nr:purine-binding chemotaxis protein CheW [Lachnospiraceae bacterium]